MAESASVRIDGGLPDWWTEDQGALNVASDDDSVIFGGYQYAPFWPTDGLESWRP